MAANQNESSNSPGSDIPAILGTTDISRACGVTIQTVQSWIDRGVLQAFRTPGGHRRVKKEDFLNFLEKFQFPLIQEIKSTIPKILIADDEKDLRDSINKIINKTFPNAVVTLCTSGADTLIHLGMAKPDLAILDVYMPGLSGVQLLEKIKDFPELKHTKVLIVTAHKHKISEDEMREKGASEVLYKPFRTQELTDVLTRLLSQDSN